MNLWIRSLTTSLLLASLLVSPVQAAATKATPAMAAVTAACIDLDSDRAGRRGCIAELQKSIVADPASVKALQQAAAGGDQSALKAVLTKLGLSDAELADATVVVEDQAKGAASRAGVTITISCCPLKIVITIRL